MFLKKRNIASADKDSMKKTLLFCAAAFLLTAAGALIAASSNGLFPFGGNSVYFSDLASEYSTYLAELSRKVHGEGSILYSWNTALGGSFWGNIFYYVSSPLNIIALFVKESAIDETVAVLIYLRQALSAAAMCFFLCRRRGGKPSFAGVVCGMLYAFCGWFCGYYYCTIWLDVFMLLPIMLLGIERLIDRKSIAVYSVALGVMLFSNFYMTYFACVFAVIYWLYYYFSNYSLKEDIRAGSGSGKKTGFFASRFFSAGALFAGASVLTVLCLAVVFVPLLLQMSRNTANLDVSSKAQYFTNITEQFSALFSGADFKTNEFKKYPAVYTGVLAIAALPLYFFIGKITKREKIAGAAVLAFMILSFNIPLLDYAWHGFRFPTNFPFREAYFFSVIVVILVYRVLTCIRDVPRAAFWSFAGGAVMIVGCAAAEKLLRGEKAAIGAVDIAVTGLLFVIFAFLLVMLSVGKREQVLPAALLIVAVCFGDSAYTFSSNIRLLDWDAATLDGEKEIVMKLLDKVDDEDKFYRTELCTSWMLNDGSYFGYNGIRQSSSMTASNTFRLLNAFGMDSNLSNFANYNMQTPVFNSIFNVKYLIERESYADYISASYMSCLNESYRIAESQDSYSLYKFGNALPFGFVADKKLTEWTVSEEDPAVNQGSFYAAAAGTEENAFLYCDENAPFDMVSDEVEVKETAPHTYEVENTAVNGNDYTPGVKVEITARKNGMVYVYAQQIADDFSNIVLYVANTKSAEYKTLSSYSTSFFGAVYCAEEGEKLQLSVYPEQGVASTLVVRAFQLDTDVFNREYEKIAAGGGLTVNNMTDRHFDGTVNVTEDDRVLCISLPYDPGWTVTLDGKKLDRDDYCLIGDILYGIPVDAGEHTVEFDYALYGLYPGLAISGAAAIFAVGWYLIRKKKEKTGDVTPITETERTEM